jgi:ACS family glucarate transporter-like MFS transporter
MQIPAGALGERFGARRTFMAVGIMGLCATLATPLLPIVFDGTTIFVALLITQGVLGLSQAPVFPMSAAVIEAWFPVNRWAIANGFQTSGMLLGGAVTPLLIVGLTQWVGWRGALLSIAPPVLLIFAAWGWYGRDSPEEHPWVRREELDELPRRTVPTSPITARRLASIVTDRNVLLLSLSYLCMNYTFYLLTFWSFLYLVQVRHFSGISSGIAGMVPWIGAAMGAAAGGVLSDRAVERFGCQWGYQIVPLISLPIVAVLLLVTISVTTPWCAVLALAAAFAGVEVNEGAYWAATMRVARADTGAAAGVLNTGGNAGGILCQPVVAVLSSAGGWEAAFATGAVLAVIAAVLWLLVDTDPVPASVMLPNGGT